MLRCHHVGITSDSKIHDNAAGPGTATEALILWCLAHDVSPHVVVTDYVPAMVDAFAEFRTKYLNDNDSDDNGRSAVWQKTGFGLVDSADQKEYADSTFSHSICNFSIFTLTHPQKCL